MTGPDRKGQIEIAEDFDAIPAEFHEYVRR